MGNSTVGGTLGVTGATTLSSTLSVAGVSSTAGIVNTGDISTTGDTTTGGNASVTGNSAVMGNSTVGGTLAVTGATTTNGITNTGNISTTGALSAATLSTSGAASIGGALNVNGNKINNVAAGTAATDAANYGQLTSAVNGLNVNIAALDKKLSGGIAASAALAALPAIAAGKTFSMGVAAAGYNGQSAIALGVQGRSAEDAIQMRAGVGYSQSKATVSGGVGFSW
jgi:hypothetical protein